MIYRPIVLDEEIIFSKKQFIISKTDIEGNILFVNQNFCNITGYKYDELIGEPHSVLRHPDMPKAIFYMIWKSLLAGMEVSAIIKNVAKSGKYYWVIADFSMQRNKYGKLETFTSFTRHAPAYVSEGIQELYDNMNYSERKTGIEGSLCYLETFLKEKHLSYNEYLEELVKPQGVLQSLIGNFQKLLS
ncbi:MAG: SIGNAL-TRANSDUCTION SENSOR PROTEIN-PAS/PAC domain [uncultured Sulfurovum sp.]|uniref:SIGNAL-TRANSDUCTION SENSOR PROTEIN-PAS/PAC domain n=1 Tax=uncultured Sulfurovum sp. TaxID=269237 RepID=A0A6S6TYQ3_9BACT|nr:MAG: SIGNAL-TRANSDUCTION SENSOR PROTEIN-PAS/PAC domain [uncultured Sulfurovum sp.]